MTRPDFLVTAALGLALGCGRSELDVPGPGDASPEALLETFTDDRSVEEETGGCGPTTCAGCCAGDTCELGAAPNACGTGGQPCTICGPELTCASGLCR